LLSVFAFSVFFPRFARETVVPFRELAQKKTAALVVAVGVALVTH